VWQVGSTLQSGCFRLPHEFFELLIPGYHETPGLQLWFTVVVHGKRCPKIREGGLWSIVASWEKLPIIYRHSGGVVLQEDMIVFCHIANGECRPRGD
jgi:hypothetical protein